MNGGAEHIIAVDLYSIFSRRPTLSQAKDLKLIRSYWNLGPMLVFDKSQIARNIRLGYLDTMKQFDVYEGIAYTFIKGSFLHIASRNTPYMTALNKACGLKFSPKPSQREALTLARIQGYLSKRYRITHSLRYADFLRSCAERAGEIFELSPEKVYSAERFRIRISEASNGVSLPEEIKTDIHEIQLTLENDTNKRISIIAEGHLDLIRKLDDALKVENEKELLLLRVATLESEIKKIKKKIEQIA